MNFALNEEQQMLSDMINRLFERDHDVQARRLALADPAYTPASLWPALAEQGILGVNIPDALGGGSAAAQDGAIATHVVMLAMGRNLALEPFVSTTVVAASLIATAGSAAQKAALLPKIMGGTVQVALAALEAEEPARFRRVSTQAARAGDDYVLDGRKVGVLDATHAGWLVVSARTSGEVGDEEGISLFLVPAAAPGVERHCGRGLDGTDIGIVTLRGVKVPASDMLGALGDGHAPLEHAVQRGLAALASEAVGVMEKLLQTCIDYLKIRKQFGRALAEFQVLQHRIAEMQTAVEQAHSMALYAAASLIKDDALERRKALAAAKSLVGKSGIYIGQEAVQLHGGVGMTEELMVGHYFRRLIAIDTTWGNAEHHAEVYAGLLAPS